MNDLERGIYRNGEAVMRTVSIAPNGVAVNALAYFYQGSYYQYDKSGALRPLPDRSITHEPGRKHFNSWKPRRRW